VLFEGRRAVGVSYRRGGRSVEARAAREVILAGGAINSPQLLMLSGVGPADHLRAHGIAVTHDLPGVGQNLQDHLELYIQYACTQPVTLYAVENPLVKLKVGIEWFLFQTGWGASAHLEAGAFIRRDASVPHPDIQFHFLPSVVNDHGRKPGDRHAFQAHVGPMRATSVGDIRLRSAKPTDHPLLQPNYLSTEQDRLEMRDAVKRAREVFVQAAFDPFRGDEIQPGPKVRSDADIDAFVRDRADSAYHPCGTCKMGSDPMAVVDAALSVRGLEGLRVVDASIMPDIVSGNLNAPVIMIAEKAADIIRGREPLAAIDAPVYVPPGRLPATFDSRAAD